MIATPAKPVDNDSLCKIENRVIKKTIEDPMISIRIHNHLKIDSNIFQEEVKYPPQLKFLQVIPLCADYQVKWLLTFIHKFFAFGDKVILFPICSD